MSNRNGPVEDRSLTSRVAHVIGRTGLAMSGAVSGTFVAAQLVRLRVELFDSIEFIALMILIGAVGFYLGIDVPQPPPTELVGPAKWNLVELFAAKGTFLAAMATLISVWAIVLDEIPSRIWEFAIGSGWVLGVVMQIGAGLTGRLRLARRAAT